MNGWINCRLKDFWEMFLAIYGRGWFAAEVNAADSGIAE
jgi:hypothetical protein